MEENCVNLKLDSVFKSFFSNKRNEKLLIDFLSSILDIPEEEISEVQVKNPETPIETVGDKFARMDLNMSVGNKNVNIEMQVEHEGAYKDRAVYYWSNLFSSLKEGESYFSIPETIAIHILNHNLFECEGYQSTFRFYEDIRHELLTDKCAIHFFELPKISDSLDTDDKKCLWLNLIKADTNERYEEIAEKGNDIMKKAVQVIYDMRADTRQKEAARLRRKSLNDKYNLLTIATDEGIAKGRAEGIAKGRAEGIAEGEAKGRAEGIAEGEAKGRAEVIKQLRKSGFTEEQIHDILSK